MKLMPVPSEKWQREYDALLKDPYLSKKYNRKKRIKDKREYINEKVPEIKKVKNKTILDLGCGPGEFLEICRGFGHNVVGIDAKLDDCEMGNEYIQLSHLMAERQGLSIYYIGLLNWLYPNPISPSFNDNSMFLINSQGSIEQIFRDYMKGPAHRLTKDSSQLSWIINDELKKVFKDLFTEFHRILEPGGYISIWGNGAKNAREYDKLLRSTISEINGLDVVVQHGNRYHKIKKS